MCALVGTVATMHAQQPAIVDVSPRAAVVGSTVTISGSGFDPVPANNAVYLGGVRAPVQTAAPTQLTIVVPPGASFGAVTVTRNGLTAVFRIPFLPSYRGAGRIDTSSFKLAVAPSSISQGPYRAAAADFDGDGRPDLAVANLTGSSVAILRNTADTLGALGFSEDADLSSGFYPEDLEVADFDGDERLDLVVAPRLSPFISVYRNISSTGTISFAPRVDIASPIGGKALAAADFDMDGRIDVALTVRQDNALTIYRNTCVPGSIAFGSGARIPTRNDPRSVAAGDVDADGKPEIFVGTASDDSAAVYRVANLASADVSLVQRIATIIEVTEMILGDVNEDGRIDLVTASDSYPVLYLFPHSGGPPESAYTTSLPIPVYAAVSEIAFGGLDADDLPDIAVGHVNVDVLSAVANISDTLGTPAFDNAVFLPQELPVRGIVAADLDLDRRPDLVTLGFFDQQLAVYRNVVATGTSIALTEGWNLVSVPRLASSFVPSFLFPGAEPGSVYGFLQGYYTSDPLLVPGQGYWAYYPAAAVNTIVGGDIDSVSVTVPTGPRWVLIGSVSVAVPAGDLEVTPAGSIEGGTLFEYSAGVFRSPVFLEPGRGYWVFVTQPCTLTIRVTD